MGGDRGPRQSSHLRCRWRAGGRGETAARRASGRSVPKNRRGIARFEPDEAAVEESFVNKNPASTLKLGVARGVVLLAPAERGIPVSEYSTNLIKKSVVGVGHAEKTQVQMMVRRLLPGCLTTSADAADALAAAICHAHHTQTARSIALSIAARPRQLARGGEG